VQQAVIVGGSATSVASLCGHSSLSLLSRITASRSSKLVFELSRHPYGSCATRLPRAGQPRPTRVPGPAAPSFGSTSRARLLPPRHLAHVVRPSTVTGPSRAGRTARNGGAIRGNGMRNRGDIHDVCGQDRLSLRLADAAGKDRWPWQGLPEEGG